MDLVLSYFFILLFNKINVRNSCFTSKTDVSISDLPLTTEPTTTKTTIGVVLKNTNTEFTMIYDTRNITTTDSATSNTAPATSVTESETSTVEIETSSTELVTSGTESVTSGTESETSGTESVTSGTESETSSTESVTSNVEIETSSTESVTSSTESETSSTESVTSSTESETSSTESVTSTTAQKEETFILSDDYFKNTCKKLPSWTPYTVTDMPPYYVNQCHFYCVLRGKFISSPFRIPDNYSCDINKICLNGECINSPSRSGVEYCRSLFPHRRITAIREEKSCMIECFDLDTLEILHTFHSTLIPEPCDYDDNQ